MSQDQGYLLTLNGGSSSIKFAVYRADERLERILDGKVERIGMTGTSLLFNDIVQGETGQRRMASSDYRSAVEFLLDWLEQQVGFAPIRAVGHRVVHGMEHSSPEIISSPLLDALHQIIPYDPEHLPGEIELIEQLRQRYPQLPQVACFDTAFHHTLPRVARLLPLPRRFAAMGLRRYGFHGLSYSYLMDELSRIGGAQAARGRVILAHLGNGASLAAVRDGNSIDTSMGFTPSGGLMMGTRSGDLDPGAVAFMMQREDLNAEQFNRLINHQSGLMGVSQSSSDMRDLLACEATDVRAAEAVELFCYQVKKWIGAYAAALNGLDTLVFTGGIGENAPVIRARICDGLTFLGVEIDESSNAVNAGLISPTGTRVTVRVMHTDEELMIARSVRGLLDAKFDKEN